MKPIDAKLAKLANKAEIKVNDRSKEEKQAYDKGFVTGVLSIALEFELDKEEVASFLEERRELTMAVELLESKRPHGKWIKEDKPWGGFGDRVLVNTCPFCKESFVYHGNNPKFCSECGADMREADDE